MKTDNKTTTTTNLPQFISKLKKQDKQFTIAYKAIKIVYIIGIAPIVVSLFMSILNSKPYTEWIGQLGILLPFVIIYFVLNKRHKEYKQQDYSQPTYLVLKNMERRYQLFRCSDLWVLFGLIILGISLGFDSSLGLLPYQLIYWTTIIIAEFFAYIYWCKKIKPMKDRASQLIKELEE